MQPRDPEKAATGEVDKSEYLNDGSFGLRQARGLMANKKLLRKRNKNMFHRSLHRVRDWNVTLRGAVLVLDPNWFVYELIDSILHSLQSRCPQRFKILQLVNDISRSLK